MASQMGLLVCMCLLAMQMQVAWASDPDPLQDYCVADIASGQTVNGYFCKKVESISTEDFFFDGLTKDKVVDPATQELKSTITFGLVKHWPALNSLGLSLVRLDLAPGGVVVPHTHALATEVIHVLTGEIYTGFVTNDNKVYAKTLKAGESFIFPRALLHFQLNVGHSHAASVNFLNSQNPGIQFMSSALFNPGIDPEVLAKSFSISTDDVKKLTSNLITPKLP